MGALSIYIFINKDCSFKINPKRPRNTDHSALGPFKLNTQRTAL